MLYGPIDTLTILSVVRNSESLLEVIERLRHQIMDYKRNYNGGYNSDLTEKLTELRVILDNLTFQANNLAGEVYLVT
jgi:hypothetical protein